MTAVLEGRGLVRRYGAHTAVDGVDLAVQAGQIVGLIGPNGAGKSTSFRMLAGLETPDAGTVWFRGEDITPWPLYRRARAGLGYLPQHPSLLPRLSVRENLEAVGDDVERILAEIELMEVADRAAGTLSGGERRRLEVARTLALRPRVVLLDEPFSGVAPAHLRSLQYRIRAMAGEGIGVLLTDHAVRAALAICDRVYLLDTGIILVSGSPSEVSSHPAARERYLGHDFCHDSVEGPLHGPAVAYNEP